MKKIILILALLIASQFHISISPREVNAQTELTPYFRVTVHYIEGMKYAIFRNVNSGGLDVVNVTKDKLEVERLQLEIARLKKLK